MNRLFLTGALLLHGSLAFGASCVSGTLQSYISLGAGGCEIGATLFNNFTTAPGQFGATEISPALIQIAPSGTFNPTLLFTLNSTAATGGLLESFFRFQATGLLNSAAIALDSASATGDGAVTAILDVCPGGSFAGNSPAGCAGGGLNTLAFRTANDSQLSGVVTSPSSFFDIFVDLTADGGASGSATLGSASVTLSSVPEPASAMLLAAGLAAFGLLRRNRRS